MADQTFKARLLQECESPDYTPAVAVAAGSVVVISGVPVVVNHDIAANKLGAKEVNEKAYALAKDTSVFADLEPVYWNPTGDPVGGTAGTGCATSVAAGHPQFGCAIKAALTGDAVVEAKMLPANRAVAPLTAVSAVAATGSIQGDAAPVTTGHTTVSAADGAVGVKLPTAVAGSVVTLKNNANAALKVWPFLGDGINAVAVNSAYSMAAFTSATFTAIDSTTWMSTPLVAS